MEIYEPEKESGPIYATLFVNKRKEPVEIMERGTMTLCILPPRREFLVEAFDPLTSYARFKEIIYLENGKLDYKLNKNWKAPDSWKGRYVLELLNTEGSNIEALYIDGPSAPPIQVYRGIPRLLSVGLDSPFLRYKRVEWRLVKEQILNPGNPNFMAWTTQVKMIREERSKAELEEIEAALKRRAIAEVERRKGSHPNVRW